MKQWMGPNDPPREAEVTMDVRVGGRKLVYTWAWESTPERESLVTLEFKPSGEGTELVLAHQRFADTQARDRHQQGWIVCLDRLEHFMSRISH
jgi:uncharacterized protein YndB with AHSA1/START domain